MWMPQPEHPLRRLFAGLTEHAFLARLGVADPPLIDYLATLMARFLHSDDLFRLRNAAGRPLHEVVDMIVEAQKLPADGRTAREVYRHIGDFTLFWTGVFPESLERNRIGKDAFVDYTAQGKRSYYLAAKYDEEMHSPDAPVLRRLSEQFELCAYGLTQVRNEWQHIGHSPN
jgi:hypothetical protein